MTGRNKDVMIYRYDPNKRYFLVSLELENKPGALGNVADLLAVRGINILEGFFGGMETGPKAVLSFFLETTNKLMDEGWLKDLLQSSVYASGVEVKSGVEGFLADSVNFPLTWNSGERAVLMRMAPLRAMLDAVRMADPQNGENALYAQGFNFGNHSWEYLLGIHRPKTKEGLGEMLKIHVASGWGRMEIIELDPGRNFARLRMQDGFECSEVTADSPVGYFTSGHVAGIMSAYFQVPMETKETRCSAKGDPYCEFEVRPKPSGP